MDETLVFCWLLLSFGAVCFLICVGIGLVLTVAHWMAAPPEGHDIPDVLPAPGTSVSDDTGEWLALNQGPVELPGTDEE